MPLKTWAPYDRLLAEDLNAAHSYLSGVGLNLPGAVCEVAGPSVTPFTVNQAQELALGQPPAGSDPLGFWQSSGRLRCPVGQGGLYLATFTVAAMALSGIATNAFHYCQAILNGSLGAGTQEQFGSFMRADSTTPVQGCTGTVIRPMVDNEEWWITLIPRIGDGKSGQVRAWSILRLASFVGAAGS